MNLAAGFFILSFAVSAFVVYMLVHLIMVIRTPGPVSWATLKAIFFASLPLTVVLAWFIAHYLEANGQNFSETPLGLRFFCSFILLILLFNGYLTFYAINDRSLSVRTMVDFYRDHNHPLTFEQLTKRYDTARSFRRRLQILEEAGYMTRIGDGLQLTSRGRKLAVTIRFLKIFYRTGKGG